MMTEKTPQNKTKTADSGAFFIFETGGKQYKVSPGDSLRIEKIGDDHKTGDTVTFDKVLLISRGGEVKIGAPYLKGETIKAVYEGDARGKKVIVLKFKSKSRYIRRGGHRQTYSKIRIV